MYETALYVIRTVAAQISVQHAATPRVLGHEPRDIVDGAADRDPRVLIRRVARQLPLRDGPRGRRRCGRGARHRGREDVRPCAAVAPPNSVYACILVRVAGIGMWKFILFIVLDLTIAIDSSWVCYKCTRNYKVDYPVAVLHYCTHQICTVREQEHPSPGPGT